MKSSKKLQISSHLLFVYINNQDRKWRISVLVFSSALIESSVYRLFVCSKCKLLATHYFPFCLGKVTQAKEHEYLGKPIPVFDTHIRLYLPSNCQYKQPHYLQWHWHQCSFSPLHLYSHIHTGIPTLYFLFVDILICVSFYLQCWGIFLWTRFTDRRSQTEIQLKRSWYLITLRLVQTYNEHHNVTSLCTTVDR